MARMPSAVWKPLKASTSRISSYDIVCIHTMVGSLVGTDGYFRRLTNGVNSHFGTDGQGAIWQWVDTAFRSGANYNGNHRIISIENADIGPGFPTWNTNDGGAVPAFTAEQCEAIARILAWAHQEHGIPLVLVPDSKPGRRGIAYHRQGVPGYVVAGGELWSTARGKVCPGNRRIAQIPGIIERAKQIVAGGPAGAYKEEDDVPYTPDQLADAASNGVANRIITDLNGKPVRTWEILRDLFHGQRAENAAVAALTKLVAEQNGLTVADVRKAVSEEIDEGIARGIKVEVSVNGEPTA